MPAVNAMSRLVLLWVSQVARILADVSLRFVAMVEVARWGEDGRLIAFPLSTALFIAPYMLLAPFNGCISNALPRRWVLSASSAFSLATVILFALLDGPWLACLGVVAVGAALNCAARYAILPAAARDAGLAMPRLSGWVELGAAGAVVLGVALGLWLPEPGWPGNGESLGFKGVGVLVGLNVLCLATALFASFRSDVRRAEAPLAAVKGFFSDLRRIGRERIAASSLIALACLQALVAGGAGSLVTYVFDPGGPEMKVMLSAIILAGLGTALGSGAAALASHPRRCLGLVPLGTVGLVASLGWGLAVFPPDLEAPVSMIPCFLLGFMGGLLNAPLKAAYLAAVPADARGNATSVMNTAIYVMTTLVFGLLIAGTWTGLLTSPLAQLAFLTVLAGLGAVAASVYFLPQLFELACAWVMSPLYRVRGHGPGLGQIPTTGPLLVVANHAAYVDPFWVGKVMPRKITPMMTSIYYDLPIIRWLMRRVVGAIRVQHSRFRREAPELAEALEVLRRDGCVLVFPEGMVRRRADQTLRMFGQGVWHLLREAPQTPVLVCWIEGGWGSCASFQGGPPFKNKRLDWLRPINVALAEPQVLDAELLADHRATRQYLMRACLECRRHLGLDVPDPEEPLAGDEAEEGPPAGVHPINS
jgi:1-acyl-sn-glycerol-3-phosphate acyltransferase